MCLNTCFGCYFFFLFAFKCFSFLLLNANWQSSLRCLMKLLPDCESLWRYTQVKTKYFNICHKCLLMKMAFKIWIISTPFHFKNTYSTNEKHNSVSFLRIFFKNKICMKNYPCCQHWKDVPYEVFCSLSVCHKFAWTLKLHT